MHELIGGWLHDAALTALFFDAGLKSLAVLAVASGMCFVLRRAAAATRHWIWFLALASLPCLALLSFVPHAWHRPLWSVSTGFDSGNQFSLALELASARQAVDPVPPVAPAGTSPAAAGEVRAASRRPIATHFSATLLVLGILVWLAGIPLGLLSMLAGQVQLRRLARDAVCLQDSEWALLLGEACEQLRLRRRVRLLQSAGNPMPLTWGGWRPVVLLPAEAADWPAGRRRVVLLHELAHAKRWDCLTQTVARFVCAIYWINPLVWLAARRMCVERERACDDLVLNTGCRASEYAAHLVEIARNFRRAPQLAGIAMARSSQLQGRIAAIVDASRVRQLRPLTALAIIVLIGALGLFVDACSPGASRKQQEDSVLRRPQIVRLQAFAQAKEKQAHELAAKAGETVTPEFQSFFNAAVQGDWQEVTNRYAYFHQHHPQYNCSTNNLRADLRTVDWQPVLEICLAYDQVVNCEPKYTAILADGIINSISPGSIYFGGTDFGRGVPTAFCKSSIGGDPFFTLSQNPLADGTYLEYLRAMYGGRIYTLTTEDSQRCFQEYMTGAMRRFQEHKLKPGEDVRYEDSHFMVSGAVAVMQINGLLTKIVFDQNTNREFYIEESFPLDWMYPYLEPHGLIMKLNRQPQTQMPEDVIARDHDYWRKLVAGMLGNWLNNETTTREVAEFVDRVYVRHDLKGFTGDPLFIQNDYAKKCFSKLRSSIAGVYAWRFSTNAPPEYWRKTASGGLFAEADLAFRQAFALCPSNPEGLSRYVDWLLSIRGPNEAVLREVPKLPNHPILVRLAQEGSNRVDQARLLIETALKLDPGNAEAHGLLKKLDSY